MNSQAQSNPQWPTLMGAIKFVLGNTIKLFSGYIFGSLVWFIVVQPYGRFFNIYQDRYWPEAAFSLFVAIIFVSSIRARSVALLFLPNLVGNATQNYVIVLLVISLFTNPISSIGNNAIESVRVIGCSLTMTYEHLKDRMKLILSPVVELLSDSSQKDLKPIEKELRAIQEIVGEIQHEASGNIKHEINAINSETRALEAAHPRAELGVIKDDISRRLEPGAKDLTDQIAAKTQELLKDSSIEFDSDKLALKTSIDVEQLAKVIGTNSVSLNRELNLTDLLHENCLGIFRKAKSNCQVAVENMRQSCRSEIGPFLAALFCSPVFLTLDTICPWLMDQLLDENSLCNEMRNSTSNLRLGSLNVTGANINEIYKDMSRKIENLNEGLLNQQPSGNVTSRPRRLELDISFNDKTRNLFLKTQNLVKFIKEKYNFRQAIYDMLSLIYEIYTTFTFCSVLAQAFRYDKKYRSLLRYDNCYITRDFVTLDRRRAKLGKSTVLPLTKDESERYITTSTCKRRNNEERKTQRASCFYIIIFLAFVLTIAYFDDVFYSILYSVHSHALIQYKELGRHRLNFTVIGEGSIARLVHRLTSNLNSVYDLSKQSSTEPCLPNPISTRGGFYIEFAFLIVIYLTIDQISIYAMRFRHLSGGFFYPEKEEQRILFLFNSILVQRRNLKISEATSYIDEDKIEEVDREAYTIRDAIKYIGTCAADSLSCRCKQR